MATKTYKTSDWATVKVTTNADWSRSATVVNSGSSGISSGTTVSRGSSWSNNVTVSNSNSNQSQSFNNINDAINYWKTAFSNVNTNTTPQINLWDLGKFGADAYNTPNFNIDARNDLIIKWLWANATNRNAVEAYLNSNQSFANASAKDKQNTIDSILRKAATVATAENPVVDVNPNQDSLVFDINDPQDYLDRLQARTALTGQQLTQEEYYNMLKAQRAIQQQQYQNPYEDYMKQLQSQLEQAQARERQRDEEAVRAYQSRLDSQYWDLINQQRQWWQASQQSAQNVYSFSGFGRSSAAANKAAEIQDTTNRAIQALNQQKLAEIELKRAELEWADGDELTYLKNQMNTLSQATTEWQLKALSEMAQANAQAGNDAVTSITNMLSAAANSWIDITWDWYERIITAFNWMTPEQQDAYLSTLSPTDQLLVLWWAANSADWNYKFVSATKYQKAWYFNEKTWEFFPLSWGGSYGWGGGWSSSGGSSSGWANYVLEDMTPTQQAQRQSSQSAISSLYNLSLADRLKLATWWNIAWWISSVFGWNLATAKNWYDYIKKNMTLNNFVNLKQSGATFGAMSNAEWDIVSQAATMLNWTLPDDQWKSELKNIATQLQLSLPSWWTTTSSTTSNNTATNTTQTTNSKATSADDRLAQLR